MRAFDECQLTSIFSIPPCWENGVYTCRVLIVPTGSLLNVRSHVVQFASDCLLSSGFSWVLNIDMVGFLLYVKKGNQDGLGLSHGICSTNVGNICMFLTTSYGNHPFGHRKKQA